MAILVTFRDKITNLGLIDFKIGLYLKTFGHQLAQNRPDATLAREH